MWPSGLTLTMTLTLNFQGQIWNLLYLRQKWSDCYETKSKHIDWTLYASNVTIGFDLGHDFDLEYFEGQIWNLLYLRQKWSDCYETKSRHIYWTQGLKCDHRFWPWPWPWPWSFKVKYGICYISTKSRPIATKRKANTSIELQDSTVTNGFDLGHDLDLWIFNVKYDFDLWPNGCPWARMSWSNFKIAVTQNGRAKLTKVRCKDLPVAPFTNMV